MNGICALIDREGTVSVLDDFDSQVHSILGSKPPLVLKVGVCFYSEQIWYLIKVNTLRWYVKNLPEKYF